jgi:hypothetical protein
MSEIASGLNSLSQEWALLRTAHPNVLLVGAEAAVVNVLDGLRPNCRQPIETREAGSTLSLPSPSQSGALILRDVGNLTQESQRCLMEWLDNSVHDRIQVIATNDAALWPQVRDGAFTEALYYRLNVIYIDLTEGAAFSTDR